MSVAPKTLQEAIKFFSDEQICIDTVAALRWPDGVTCVACGHKDHYWLASQKRWKCKDCYKQFSVKVNTIFEDSPLGLDKWLIALWMLVNCKNGISSYEVARDLGISQKSAWFMLHRLRLALSGQGWGNPGKLGGEGECEVDETFIGGKVKNMHTSRRLKLAQMKSNGLKNETKTIVAGILDRKQGVVRAKVVPNREKNSLEAIVHNNIKFGSVVYTDDHTGYIGLRHRYTHEVINKMEGYIRGNVHTQGIENFWALLKRGLSGTYVCVEPEHLHRYLDEQMYRFNNRKDSITGKKLKDADRFAQALSQIAGKRLTFAEVTGKTGERF
jgi:transposase-like protein